MHYFSPLNTFMRKGKYPEPDPDPHLWLMDPDPGGPKKPADPVPDPQHCIVPFLCREEVRIRRIRIRNTVIVVSRQEVRYPDPRGRGR